MSVKKIIFCVILLLSCVGSSYVTADQLDTSQQPKLGFSWNNNSP